MGGREGMEDRGVMAGGPDEAHTRSRANLWSVWGPGDLPKASGRARGGSSGNPEESGRASGGMPERFRSDAGEIAEGYRRDIGGITGGITGWITRGNAGAITGGLARRIPE